MKINFLCSIVMFSTSFALTAQTNFGPKQTINANMGNNPYAIA